MTDIGDSGTVRRPLRRQQFDSTCCQCTTLLGLRVEDVKITEAAVLGCVHNAARIGRPVRRRIAEAWRARCEKTRRSAAAANDEDIGIFSMFGARLQQIRDKRDPFSRRVTSAGLSPRHRPVCEPCWIPHRWS
jgi:hypothetical protein